MPRATAAWIEGATEQTAARDVSPVLSAFADAAGDAPPAQILLQFPVGYDLLFGRPLAPGHPCRTGTHLSRLHERHAPQ